MTKSFKDRLMGFVSFGLSLIVTIWKDTIINLPYAGELLFAVILFLVVFHGRREIVRNNKSKSGEEISIRHQLDFLNMIGIAIIGLMFFFIGKESLVDGEYLTVITSGLVIILLGILGIVNPKSISLSKIDKYKLGVIDKDFEINIKDQKVIFTEFKIIAISSSGEARHLRDLIINREEAMRIAAWIYANLKPSNLDYYWHDGEKSEKLNGKENSTEFSSKSPILDLPFIERKKIRNLDRRR